MARRAKRFATAEMHTLCRGNAGTAHLLSKSAVKLNLQRSCAMEYQVGEKECAPGWVNVPECSPVKEH